AQQEGERAETRPSCRLLGETHDPSTPRFPGSMVCPGPRRARCLRRAPSATRMLANHSFASSPRRAQHSGDPTVRSSRANQPLQSKTLTLSMSMAATVALSLAVTFLAPTSARAQKKAAKGVEPVRVLMLAGGQRSHHGYRDQALYLSNAL